MVVSKAYTSCHVAYESVCKCGIQVSAKEQQGLENRNACCITCTCTVAKLVVMAVTLRL